MLFRSLVGDELEPHDLRHVPSGRRVQAEEHGGHEHEDAEDRLQGERGPDGAEDLVDEGGQGDEGDDVGGDDEHELARAEDGVAEEGEEGLLGGPVTVLLEDIGDQGAEPARVGLALLLVPGVIGGGAG